MRVSFRTIARFLALAVTCATAIVLLLSPADEAGASTCGRNYPQSFRVDTINLGNSTYTTRFEFSLTTAELTALRCTDQFLEIDFDTRGFDFPAHWTQYRITSNLPHWEHDVNFLDGYEFLGLNPPSAGLRPVPAISAISTGTLVAHQPYFVEMAWDYQASDGESPAVSVEWVPSHWGLSGPGNFDSPEPVVNALCSLAAVAINDAWCVFRSAGAQTLLTYDVVGWLNFGGYNSVTSSLPWSYYAGDIVRWQDGTSWLVSADGRHWIPTGGDFECFVAEGATVHDLASDQLNAIPDVVGDHAICQPGVVVTSLSPGQLSGSPSAIRNGLVRTSAQDIYWVDGDGTAYHLLSMQSVECWGGSWTNVSQATFAGFTDSGRTLDCSDRFAGEMVRDEASGSIAYVNTSGTAHPIGNMGIVECFGGSYTNLSAAAFASIPNNNQAVDCGDVYKGEMVRNEATGAIAYVNVHGTAHPIGNMTIVGCFGGSYTNVSVETWANIPNNGQSVHCGNTFENQTVRTESGGIYQVNSNGEYHAVPNMTVYGCLGSPSWVTISSDVLANIPNSGENAHCGHAYAGQMVKYGRGIYYVSMVGKLHPIGSMSVVNCKGGNWIDISRAVLNNIPRANSNASCNTV